MFIDPDEGREGQYMINNLELDGEMIHHIETSDAWAIWRDELA